MPKLYPAPGQGFQQPSAIMNLEGLISALESFGCTVTNAGHYLQLRRRPLPSLPEIPPSLLSMTVEQVEQDGHDYALRAVSEVAARDRRSGIDRALDTEMAEIMKTEVDDYLDVLRPKSNAAAAEARAVLDFGIEPNDSAEKVMGLGGSASERWISFKAGSKSVNTLQRISSIRASLAEATDAGEGPGADHSVGITNPFIPQTGQRMRPDEPAHVVWLRAARQLDLVPVRDLNEETILIAQGQDVEEIRSMAATFQTNN